MALHFTWVFAFGLLGNIISFLVCLAPLPTFYLICKKKTSEGFQSLPYVIALFSAMLWLFYAIFQKDTFLLITINSFTFFMELAYIAVYIFYGTKKDRMVTVKLFLLFNVFAFGAIVVTTLFLTKGQKRVSILGWICMIFSLCVFVAPLGIVRKVIKTKSVEYMPISLSVSLTLGAVMWFFYGYLKKDYYVAVPNILGFTFGVIQMVLYMIYRNPKKSATDLPNKADTNQLQEVQVIDISKLSTVCTDNNTVLVVPHNDESVEIEVKEQVNISRKRNDDVQV